jgi:hypothetical protein
MQKSPFSVAMCTHDSKGQQDVMANGNPEDMMQCVKCTAPATIASPSGTPYCQQHGHCTRKVYGVVRDKKQDIVVVVRRECKTSVADFVVHPRMGIYICPCVLAYEREMQKITRGAS